MKSEKKSILFKSLSDKNIAKCANSEIECFAGIWTVEHTKQVTECILYVCVNNCGKLFIFLFFECTKSNGEKKSFFFCFDDLIVCHSYVITKLWTLFLLFVFALNSEKSVFCFCSAVQFTIDKEYANNIHLIIVNSVLSVKFEKWTTIKHKYTLEIAIKNAFCLMHEYGARYFYNSCNIVSCFLLSFRSTFLSQLIEFFFCWFRYQICMHTAYNSIHSFYIASNKLLILILWKWISHLIYFKS